MCNIFNDFILTAAKQNEVLICLWYKYADNWIWMYFWSVSIELSESLYQELFVRCGTVLPSVTYCSLVVKRVEFMKLNDLIKS